jgi:hypothetical protein
LPSFLKAPFSALLATAGFAALALYLTDPLRTVLTQAWAGGGELEEWIWNYWFFKKLIAEHFQNEPHPWLMTGKLLMRLTDSFTDIGNYLDLLIFSIPLEARLGAPEYYNIKVLLVLVLNGLGGFFLFRHLAGEPWAAFFGGAALAFNSYTAEMINAARIREAFIAPIPLFVLFLLKTLDERDFRNPLMAGVFLGLSAAVYWFYGIFLFYFIVVFLIVRLIGRTLTKGAFARLAVIGLTAFVIVLPFGADYLKPFVTKEFRPHRRLFIPPNPLPSYREITADVPGRNDYNINNFRIMLKDSRTADFPVHVDSHHRIYAILLILALALVWRKCAWPWLASAIVFYMLTLGPYLKMGFPESFVFGPGGEPIQLPYAMAYTWTPVMPRLYHPNRAMVFLFLGLAALFCINWAFIRERLRISMIVNIIIIGAITAGLALHLRQSGQFPTAISNLHIPAYYRSLAVSGGGNIVEAPWQPSKDNDWMLYQTVHGRRILWGSAYSGDFDQNENSFVQYVRSLNDFKADSYRKEDLDQIKAKGFSTLLLHEVAC